MIGVCEPERSKLYRQNCVHLHSLNVSSIVVTELDRNMNWWMSHCSKFSIKPYCVPFLRTVFRWVGACSSWGTVCVAASEQPQWLLLSSHMYLIVHSTNLKINTCHWQKGWRTSLGAPEFGWRNPLPVPVTLQPLHWASSRALELCSLNTPGFTLITTTRSSLWDGPSILLLMAPENMLICHLIAVNAKAP